MSGGGSESAGPAGDGVPSPGADGTRPGCGEPCSAGGAKSGLGVEDVSDPKRLGFLFKAATRPKLDVAETALRQVDVLGLAAAARV